MARGEEVDRKIYDAAMALLRAHGPGAVTVESVAAQSGVARTTIYRRHKDRDAVLEAALNDHIVSRVLEPGADIWHDVLAVLNSLASTFENRVSSGIFIALLDEQDPEQVELIREKFLRSRVGLVVARLRVAVRQGELRPDLDPEVVADLLLGAVAARFAYAGTFPPAWAESVLATLRPALEPHPGEPPA